MDPKVKAGWVAALRSGKYKQGDKALKRNLGANKAQYCCLGVLCDITPGLKWADGSIEPEALFVEPQHVGDPGEEVFEAGDGQLTATALQYFGFSEDLECELILMNDGPEGNFSYPEEVRFERRKHDFNEIADFIEENL